MLVMLGCPKWEFLEAEIPLAILRDNDVVRAQILVLKCWGNHITNVAFSGVDLLHKFFLRA